MFRSNFFKNAGTYTFANILNSAIPFFLMPVLTRHMSPSDYGIVAMFTVLLGFVSPFTGLSINGAIVRQYYEKELIDLPVYVTNCLLILACSSMLVSVVFYMFSGPISRISSFPEKWLWIIIIVSIGQFITLVNLSLWQVQLKAKVYGLYQISRTTVNILLSIWMVVALGMAWKGRVQAQFYTMCLFGALGLFLLYRGGWLKFSFNLDYIRNALKFGVPLIPHAIGAIVITMTDRFFITNMVGLAATGLYSVGYQVGMVIGLLATSFNQAYVPWLFERLKKDDEKIKIRIVKLTYVYFVAILAVALIFSWVAPIFLNFFVGKRFAGASAFVFWIALGYAFSGMYMMVVNYIFYVQKTHILAWVTFFCAIVNVLLNYFLIKANGAIGAAQAATFTFFLSFFLTMLLSRKVYRMPWLFFLRQYAT